MRSVNSLILAGMAALLSSTAFAADVPAIMPPPPGMYAPQPVYAPQPAYAPPPQMYAPPPQAYAPASYGDDFGGWYLRGDIGVSQQSVKSLFNVLYEAPGTSVQTVGAGFDSATLFGIGVGYQFGGFFRADVTGEYRGKSRLHGLDIVSFNGGVVGTDEYHGSKQDFLALINIYADLGTWWCITPFIGAGFGGNYAKITNFTDINTANAGVAYARDESKFSFAYALHAGLAYKVSSSLTMELAYRYVSLGDAMSGDLRTYTGTNNVNNPMHFRDISSHDIRMGVRWTCCEPAAPVAPPPVLMRRG